MQDNQSRIDKISQILDDKKAVDIESFDLTGKDYIADVVIVATTLNSKHAYSMLGYLKDELKSDDEVFLRIDEDDDWTIIDLGDLIIHLMSTEYRERYHFDDFLYQIKGDKVN